MISYFWLPLSTGLSVAVASTTLFLGPESFTSSSSSVHPLLPGDTFLHGPAALSFRGLLGQRHPNGGFLDIHDDDDVWDTPRKQRHRQLVRTANNDSPPDEPDNDDAVWVYPERLLTEISDCSFLHPQLQNLYPQANSIDCVSCTSDRSAVCVVSFATECIPHSCQEKVQCEPSLDNETATTVEVCYDRSVSSTWSLEWQYEEDDGTPLEYYGQEISRTLTYRYTQGVTNVKEAKDTAVFNAEGHPVQCYVQIDGTACQSCQMCPRLPHGSDNDDNNNNRDGTHRTLDCSNILELLAAENNNSSSSSSSQTARRTCDDEDTSILDDILILGHTPAMSSSSETASSSSISSFRVTPGWGSILLVGWWMINFGC